MNRAYSTLEIKAVDEQSGRRKFTGIASTPATDRMGDVVEPTGAQFKLPIPLLWQHNSREPIGWVTSATVTDKGIEVEAELATIADAGKLKERLDEAWQMLKAKLVRGLSIGFNSIESARIDGSAYGIKFLKWEWLELSAVTIAANQHASISIIRSIDQEILRAAFGTGQSHPDRRDEPSPGVPGTKKGAADRGPFSSNPKEHVMKPLSEQITALEAGRSAKGARMQDLMQKSIDDGRSTTDEEKIEFDQLKDEVEEADGDLVRLRHLEKMMLANPTPVTKAAGENSAAASAARGGMVLSSKSNLPPGIALAQFAKCLAQAQGSRSEALEIGRAKERALDARVVPLLKAAVLAGSTANGNWAANLVGDEASVYADFLEFLRPMTILGKFGANGIPSLRRVPFRVPLIGQTGGGSGYWVGEGKAKPLTSFDFSRTTIEPLKVANIAVLTEESIRDSSPSSDVIVRDALVQALRARLDTDFVNPDKAASAGVSPASITNGVTAIGSSGVDADAVRADIKALFGVFIAASNPPTSGVWIMSASTALSLSLMTNPLGQPEFSTINMMGGTFFGLPVLVSEYMAADTNGGFVAIVNAQDIYLADEGGFMVDVSREASLAMADDAGSDMDSTTPNPASVVSMYQTNSVAFRAERTVNWARRRTSAVALLDGVAWA